MSNWISAALALLQLLATKWFSARAAANDAEAGEIARRNAELVDAERRAASVPEKSVTDTADDLEAGQF